jgi:hypothetical protein
VTASAIQLTRTYVARVVAELRVHDGAYWVRCRDAALVELVRAGVTATPWRGHGAVECARCGHLRLTRWSLLRGDWEPCCVACMTA